MRRRFSIIVIMSCLILSLSGCSLIKDTNKNTKNDDHLELVLQNSMIIDLTDYNNQFLNIIDEIKKEPNKKEYIDGMIDGFLSGSQYSTNTVHSILTQQNMSSDTANQLIDPNLSGPLNKLFTQSMPSYLNTLRKQKSYLEIDTNKINEIENLFMKFNGSSERYTEKKSVNKILKATNKLNDLLN